MSKRIILVDGNNLMFRSYYATAYTGNIMKNSKGLPTNALYGFVSMINKIIIEEKPLYMAVAFDMGKNFRTEKYGAYKAGRIGMPDDLKLQMPISKDILEAMGIRYFELEPYEADDIIGTFAKMADIDPDYDATIVSSDKDLLQLISPVVDVKLLKQKDHIRYNPETFKADYGIDPIRIIDLKALMGDASDNIPGVKGIGEKTALSLLQKYGSLENVYERVDEITGKVREKLIADIDNAYLSKEIATIYKDVPIKIASLEEIKYAPKSNGDLNKIYEDLEFYSLIKNDIGVQTLEKQDFKEVLKEEDIKGDEALAFYIECNNENYHIADILGMSLSDSKNNYYISKNNIQLFLPKIINRLKYTYDLKKNIILLKRIGLEINSCEMDAMIAAYLLEYNVKEDIAYLMNPESYSVPFYETLLKEEFKDVEKLKNTCVLKARFIYSVKDKYIENLEKEEMLDLFRNIEMPLIEVLADMEHTGIHVDKTILDKMREETEVKIEILAKTIYNQAGMEFNISSPKQLGEVLFDHLELPMGKKTRGGKYTTNVKMLNKLINVHPIITNILEYRNLAKLLSTYLESLKDFIHEDGKIHTIYRQTLTRTGRLSSVEPNLQNIPTKDDEGRKVRKAFLPSEDSVLMCSDYSQIELRILAHISDSPELIEAFVKGQDIHTKVAADIFGVDEINVTKKMRKSAKAVIFGIVYGISGFGLGENLEISSKEANEFINKYFEFYPNVKKYMEDIVKVAYEQGYVRSLFNRKRVIEELKNKNYMIRQSGERIALNTPIQGTEADIIKKAMVEIYDAFKKENIKSKMILQVHDELVFDCKISEKEKVLDIVTKIMENTIVLKVPISVESDFGSNWYEAK